MTAILYVVYDQHEKRCVGRPYKSRCRATTRADKLDLAYGAYRYTVRPISEVSK